MMNFLRESIWHLGAQAVRERVRFHFFFVFRFLEKIFAATGLVLFFCFIVFCNFLFREVIPLLAATTSWRTFAPLGTNSEAREGEPEG